MRFHCESHRKLKLWLLKSKFQMIIFIIYFVSDHYSIHSAIKAQSTSKLNFCTTKDETKLLNQNDKFYWIFRSFFIATPKSSCGKYENIISGNKFAKLLSLKSTWKVHEWTYVWHFWIRYWIIILVTNPKRITNRLAELY